MKIRETKIEGFKRVLGSGAVATEGTIVSQMSAAAQICECSVLIQYEHHPIKMGGDTAIFDSKSMILEMDAAVSEFEVGRGLSVLAEDFIRRSVGLVNRDRLRLIGSQGVCKINRGRFLGSEKRASTIGHFWIEESKANEVKNRIEGEFELVLLNENGAYETFDICITATSTNVGEIEADELGTERFFDFSLIHNAVQGLNGTEINYDVEALPDAILMIIEEDGIRCGANVSCLSCSVTRQIGDFAKATFKTISLR